jgi:hypothetical protein
MTESTKQTLIATSGVTVSIVSMLAFGVLGNNHADDARTQMETACVKAGGSWISDEMACRR